ncbi:MAG: hypothetical protein IH921_06000 [Gemmatimonadetes bacterium]|nr:hypothetical protein [Gemmatimonadota bacterium]
MIEKPPYQNELGRSQPLGPPVQIEILGKIRSPEDDPFDGGLSRRHPPTHGVGTL